jgi:hypothetical protein
VTNSIDLNNPPADHNLTVKVEKTESDGDRYVRLFKDVLLFLVAVGFVVMVAWLCVETLHSASATAEEKKWAMSVIAAATGGIIGYLVRK